MPNTSSPVAPTGPSQSKPRSVPSRLSSITVIVLAWLLLQIGGLFSPGLLDDVDSIYIEIAREMLHRHDFVTPYINGIRFFDKPPLMYWMASSSMAVFGETDWAARLPLALATLALFFAVYALGKRLFDERAGLYAALATATSIGPYLYTRFFIPDILICLWMTLTVHLFLIAISRAAPPEARVPHPLQSHRKGWVPATAGIGRVPHPLQSHRKGWAPSTSTLLPCLALAAVLALNLLTKGLIGLIFPVGFMLVYLLLTRQFRLLPKLHPFASVAVFLVLAAPWHILAALRNPVIPLPQGVGLPATGGWAWFYLYNEHFARFLGKRIPHDYGNTPVCLFWVYALLWVMPWAAFLPEAMADAYRNLKAGVKQEAALSLTLWAALVLGFFSVSSRQEYYSLPAIPALALLIGGALSRAEVPSGSSARRAILRGHLWLLVPIATVVAIVCGYFALTAPHPAPGTDIASLLAGNPDLYNLSLGHIFDLTGAAMGLFRAPLAGVALAMLLIGPGSYLLRRAGRQFAANLTLATAMVLTLTCAHEGLRRFYPILGSKEPALAIERIRQPGDLIVLDGELTSGSTLIFYTHQQVHLVDGRINGLWYGSFWPDAPHIFETEASLRSLWAGPRRIFLLTYHEEARVHDLPAARILARSGGKTVLTNR